MSDKLSIPEIIQNGSAIGVQYIVPIVVNGILTLISIWIPYLNGGILIAWMTMPVKMARGETIEMTEIWKAEHRQKMGDVFVAFGLMVAALLGTYVLLFMGVVLYYGWTIAMQLVIDKGLTGPEAFKQSWSATLGSKLTIWLADLVFIIGYLIVNAILGAIGGLHSILFYLTFLLNIGLALALIPIFKGMHAYVYKKLAA